MYQTDEEAGKDSVSNPLLYSTAEIEDGAIVYTPTKIRRDFLDMYAVHTPSPNFKTRRNVRISE